MKTQSIHVRRRLRTELPLIVRKGQSRSVFSAAYLSDLSSLVAAGRRRQAKPLRPTVAAGPRWFHSGDSKRAAATIARHRPLIIFQQRTQATAIRGCNRCRCGTCAPRSGARVRWCGPGAAHCLLRAWWPFQPRSVCGAASACPVTCLTEGKRNLALWMSVTAREGYKLPLPDPATFHGPMGHGRALSGEVAVSCGVL